MLFPSPPLQPGVEGMELAEKINVLLSWRGLGPRWLRASQAPSYIMKTSSNLKANASKNNEVQNFGVFWCFYLDIFLIFTSNSLTKRSYVSLYLSIVANINVIITHTYTI